MNNNNSIICGSVGTTLSAIGTALQTNDYLQTISLIVTIIGSIVTFIIMPLLNWFKKAKEDGKIDAKEAKEATDIILQGGKKVIDGVKKAKAESEEVETADKREDIKKKGA